MEIIAVANRLNHILSGQAEKFSALGLEAKTVTIYTDKDFNECNAPDKKMVTIPDSFHANAAFADNELYWSNVEKFMSKHFR